MKRLGSTGLVIAKRLPLWLLLMIRTAIPAVCAESPDAIVPKKSDAVANTHGIPLK